MNAAGGACWTLDDLSRLANQALAVDYPGALNGRVRDRPDPRTIRYYTTLGLLDRPAAFRGRTALYGRRHLLQLVAIKRLQAEGLSLRTVQERMLGLSDRRLEELARVPPELDLPDAPVEAPAGPPDGPPEEPAGRREFWKEPAAAPEPSPEVLQTVALGGGAMLIFPWPEPPGPAELHEMRAAAQPLLHFLQSRRPRPRVDHLR